MVEISPNLLCLAKNNNWEKWTQKKELWWSEWRSVGPWKWWRLFRLWNTSSITCASLLSDISFSTVCRKLEVEDPSRAQRYLLQLPPPLVWPVCRWLPVDRFPSYKADPGGFGGPGRPEAVAAWHGHVFCLHSWNGRIALVGPGVSPSVRFGLRHHTGIGHLCQCATKCGSRCRGRKSKRGWGVQGDGWNSRQQGTQRQADVSQEQGDDKLTSRWGRLLSVHESPNQCAWTRPLQSVGHPNCWTTGRLLLHHCALHWTRWVSHSLQTHRKYTCVTLCSTLLMCIYRGLPSPDLNVVTWMLTLITTHRLVSKSE